MKNIIAKIMNVISIFKKYMIIKIVNDKYNIYNSTKNYKTFNFQILISLTNEFERKFV